MEEWTPFWQRLMLEMGVEPKAWEREETGGDDRDARVGEKEGDCGERTGDCGHDDE